MRSVVRKKIEPLKSLSQCLRSQRPGQERCRCPCFPGYTPSAGLDV